MFLYFAVYILLTTEIHLLLCCKAGNESYNGTEKATPDNFPPSLCALNDTSHFECSESGNFSNSIDLSCGSYYKCEEGDGGDIVKTLNLCPTGSYYDPNAASCSPSYQCPCSLEDEGDILEIDLVETCVIEDDPDYFECTSKGKFPNRNDPTCRSYFVCKRQILTGKFIKTKHICPIFKNFDPILGVCRLTYKCICTQPTTEKTTELTTTEISTTIETCVTEENPDYLVCTKNGKFPNLNDPICQTYFLCERLFLIGKYVKTKYSCLADTYFDPDTEVCSALYECPCTPTVTSTTELIPTTDSSCVIEDNPDYFKCTTKGRFPNLSDPTCESYFQCTNLLFWYIKTLYYCPSRSYFDPNNQICSDSYVCPCSQVTTSTQPPTTSTEHYSKTSDTTDSVLTTAATCDYEENPDYFACSMEGKFPNKNDLTCRSYFLCSRKGSGVFSGTFVKTKYTCPAVSYFDPSLGICSVEYTCPCTSGISTTERYATTTSSDSADTTPAIPSTTINSDTTSSASTTSLLTTTQSTTTTETCDYEEDPDYFTCTVKGRFPNKNDLTCETYFLCSQKSSGAFVKTKYTCPATSYFDQSVGICSVEYTCPCTTDSSTTERYSTTTSSDSADRTTETSSTTINSDTTSSGSTTTTQSTTTTETCDYEEDPDYFTCTAKGRFSNKNDLTCQTYFLCSQKGSGAFVKTKYTCPTTSYFDQSVGICSVEYTCPCTSGTSTTERYSTTTSSDSADTTTGSPSTAINSDTTSSESTTTTQSTTTAETCDYEEDPDYFTCTAKGSFPNKNDLTCQTYFLCIQKGSGAFVKIKYTCPTSSYFDQSLGICSDEYTCPCTSETSTTERYSTTTSTDSADTTTESPSTPIKSDTTSSDSADTTTEILSTTINSDTTSSASTTSLLTTTQSTTTAETCDYEEDPDYFTCTAKGSFPNKNDLTCQTYFLCIQKGSGAFVKIKYTCPTSSYFDQSLGICSDEYTCPCTSETSTTERYSTTTSTDSADTTTESPSTPIKSDTTSSDSADTTTEILSTTINSDTTSSASTTSLLTTTQSTTTAETCDYEEDPDYFTCTAKGRFPNKNDLTCQTYFLCSQKGSGAFVKTKYTCPTTSYFDQSLGICSDEYTCPCTTESSTTKRYSTTTSNNSAYTTTESPSTTIKSDTTSSAWAATTTEIPSTTINSDTTSTESTTSVLTTTQSTTTTETCDYEEDPDYFTCTAKGRFPNKNDLTCQTYFLCSQKGSGAFVKTKYTCPTTSYFDQSLGICSDEYTCPCTTESSTTERYSTTTSSDSADTTTESHSTTIKSDTTSSDSTETTTEIRSTTINSDTTSSETTTSVLTTTQSTTTTETCDYEEDPDYFTCTAKGRFPNKNDLTCQTYFLCSQKSSGAFVKTKYTCPTSSYFDQTLGICSDEYTCPCTTESSTTERYSTTTSSDSADTTTESHSTTIKSDTTSSDSAETTTEIRSTTINSDTTSSETTTSVLTTTQSTTTTETCDYEEDPDYFTCTAKGRFPNKNDLTCQTYFLCSQKSSGAFVKTKYTCPTSSYFDQTLGICSDEYICPCTTETSTTERYSSTTFSDSADTTTESPSTTIKSDTTSSAWAATTTESPSTTINSDTTSSEFTTTTQSTTTTESCDYEEDPDYFTCIAKGRFPNKNDLTCQTYFLCSQKGSGAFVKTKYTCPTTSYFDQSLGICSDEYTCPCTTESTTTERYSTTKSSDSADTTTESPSTTINSDTTSSDSAATTTEIPSTTINSDTTSSESTTTTQSTTTTEICDYEEDPDYFTCTAKGRFPNKNDLTCQTYFLCSQKSSGAFIKTKYTCPTTSYFDQSLGICSDEYTCPCTSEASTTERYSTPTSTDSADTTTESPSTPIKSDTTSSDSADTTTEILSTTINSDTTSSESTISVLTTTQSTTTAETCDYVEDPDYFTCTAKGRFPNKNDLTCQTYFLCSQKGSGAFVKTKYTCPTTSYFDQSLGICSDEYTCPCTTEITTTERYSTTTSSDSADTTTESPSTTIKSDTTSSASAATTTEIPSTTINSDITSSESTTSVLTTTQSTTTTETCDYEEDPDYFTCTAKGKFSNKNDLTCQTYFLCSQKGSGAFVKTKYMCPTTSYFDQSLGICSDEYTCPCTRESSTTERYSTTTSSDSAETTTEIRSTTINSDTTSSEFTTSILTMTQSTTTAETCDYVEDPDYFTCTAKGRFPNKNDLTCQTYFLCSQKGSGAFVKTMYTCPTTSYFDQSLGICSDEYTCPCTTETSTTESYSTTTSSDLADTTTESPSTTIKSGTTYSDSAETTTEIRSTTINSDTTFSETTTSVLTTTQSTTTTEICDYEEDPDYFTCRAKGRFPNKNDLTCQTYFLCSQKSSGAFVKTKYTCPTTSYFDQSLGICSDEYTCPCTTENATTERLSTTTSSDSADITTEIPSTTINSDTTSSESTTSLSTTTQSTTTSEACDYEEDPDYFVCTAKGRFPNKNDLTCRSYFLCSQKKSGVFVKTKFTCPSTSYFDSSYNVCNSEYVCPCNSIQ